MKANINVQDKAALVVLNCAFSWGTVTDKRITEQNIADAGAVAGSLRTRKSLLPKASGVLVDTLKTALSSFYNGHHLTHTFSTPIVGQRIMPQAFYMAYMEKYGEAQAAARAALDALVEGYDAAVHEARALLGGAFNIDDYPPASEIPHFLNFNVRFLPVPSGNAILNALGAEVAADVDTYVDEVMKTAAADAKKRLRDAVERMATVLTADKAKIYATMPQAINELAETLPVLAGLADDDELKSLIKEVQQRLAGYDAEDFKKNDAVRTQVGKQAMEMLKRMGG